jgi:FkbM family methyltransferase
VSSGTKARDLIERLARLADTALSPGALRAARRCRPLSVASLRLVRGLADAGVAPDLVIDVGANKGQFAASALFGWPRAQVVSFEPIAALAEQVAAISSGGRLTVHQMALGRESGTVELHVHAYSPSSSALRSLDAGAEVTTQTVPLRRLADEVAEPVGRAERVLLKLDVQGLELAVLDGAAELLGQVEWILVEQAFVAAYDDQPLFDEVHAYLGAAGFSLDRPLDVRREGGRIVEADSLYVRQVARPEPT